MAAIDTGTNTVTGLFDWSGFGAPYGLAVSPDGNSLWATQYDNMDVKVLLTADGSVVDTIGVGSSPTDVVFSPDGNASAPIGTPTPGTGGAPGTFTIVNSNNNKFGLSQIFDVNYAWSGGPAVWTLNTFNYKSPQASRPLPVRSHRGSTSRSSRA